MEDKSGEEVRGRWSGIGEGWERQDTGEKRSKGGNDEDSGRKHL